MFVLYFSVDQELGIDGNKVSAVARGRVDLFVVGIPAARHLRQVPEIWPANGVAEVKVNEGERRFAPVAGLFVDAALLCWPVWQVKRGRSGDGVAEELVDLPDGGGRGDHGGEHRAAVPVALTAGR